jgi:hypothetical protein
MSQDLASDEGAFCWTLFLRNLAVQVEVAAGDDHMSEDHHEKTIRIHEDGVDYGGVSGDDAQTDEAFLFRKEEGYEEVVGRMACFQGTDYEGAPVQSYHRDRPGLEAGLGETSNANAIAETSETYFASANRPAAHDASEENCLCCLRTGEPAATGPLVAGAAAGAANGGPLENGPTDGEKWQQERFHDRDEGVGLFLEPFWGHDVRPFHANECALEVVLDPDPRKKDDHVSRDADDLRAFGEIEEAGTHGRELAEAGVGPGDSETAAQ